MGCVMVYTGMCDYMMKDLTVCTGRVTDGLKHVC